MTRRKGDGEIWKIDDQEKRDGETKKQVGTKY